jgi:hypothetical protein
MVQAIDDILAPVVRLPLLPKLQQMAGLDLKESGLDGGRATQPPQANLRTNSLSTADCASKSAVTAISNAS